MSSLPPRRGAYGFDAPYAPLLMALGGACLLARSAWELWSGAPIARRSLLVRRRPLGRDPPGRRDQAVGEKKGTPLLSDKQGLTKSCVPFSSLFATCS
jgi:hypothetical protein